MAVPANPPDFHLKKNSPKFLVSACLVGMKCTCRGKDSLKGGSIKRLSDLGIALAICPEVMGGLPIPREEAEIGGGDGKDVLEGNATVMTISGKDVSKNFVLGAHKAFRAAGRYGIKKAILKSNSPSCGYGRIYDGTFKKVLKSGSGVLAALLGQNGINPLSIPGLKAGVFSWAG